MLIDVLGDFARSSREGLPIYRILGGAGFLLAASYRDDRRGTLRISAVDASRFVKPTIAAQSAEPTAPPNRQVHDDTALRLAQRRIEDLESSNARLDKIIQEKTTEIETMRGDEASAQRASLAFDDERKRFMILIALLTAAVFILALAIAYLLVRQGKKKFSDANIDVKKLAQEVRTNIGVLEHNLPSIAAQNVADSTKSQSVESLSVQEEKQIATLDQIKSSPAPNVNTRSVPQSMLTFAEVVIIGILIIVAIGALMEF
jgi:hypothetical protein